MMMVIYLLLHDIFIGLFQKSTTPHLQRKFLLSREGNRMKNVLNLYRMSIRGGGGIVNFLHGGYGYFLEQPILWKHKKKILSRNKLPCIFNNHINCSNKNLTTNFFVELNNCNVEIVHVCRCNF